MKQLFYNSWQSAESNERVNEVFDNRFKEYGAYQIRTHYNRNVVLSMIATVALLSLAITSSTLFSKTSETTVNTALPEIKMTDVKILPNFIESTLTQKPTGAENQNSSMTAGIPEIANPWTEAILPGLPSLDFGTESYNGGGVGSHKSNGQSDDYNNSNLFAKDTIITEKIDRLGMFVGGEEAFVEFVKSNFDNAICEAENGIGIATLRFLIDKSGKISQISVVETSKSCPEFGQEAIRVLSISPRWIPAMSHGKLVTAWREVKIKMESL